MAMAGEPQANAVAAGRTVDFYVQCNPFVDVVGTVEAAVLEGLGLTVGSAAVADDLDGTVRELFAALAKAKATAQVGGAGLATARYANWLLRGDAFAAPSGTARPPTVVGYFGGVGNDADGALIRDTLLAEGVVPLLLCPPSSDGAAPPTGRCAVAVVGSERTVLACPGAWSMLRPDPSSDDDDAPSGAVEARRSATIVYAPAFSLVADKSHVLAVAAEASARGKLVVTNIGAAFLLTDPAFAERTLQLLRAADVIVGNADEADALAGLLGLPRLERDSHSQEAVKSWLSATAFKVSGLLYDEGPSPQQQQQPAADPSRVGKCVVFTNGAAGAVAGIVTPAVTVGRRHGSYRDDEDDEPDATVVSEPTPPLGGGAAVVDTAGAGDAFIGGFCAGVFEMLRQLEVHDDAMVPPSSVRQRFFAGVTRGYAANARTLLRVGHWCAGHIVQQPGCLVPREPAAVLNGLKFE